MFLCLVCPWYSEYDHFRFVWENSLIRVSAHLTEDTKGRRSIHDQTTVAHERVLEAFPLIVHINLPFCHCCRGFIIFLDSSGHCEEALAIQLVIVLAR